MYNLPGSFPASWKITDNNARTSKWESFLGAVLQTGFKDARAYNELITNGSGIESTASQAQVVQRSLFE